MRGPRFWGALAVLFVLGGAFGGWCFLSEMALPSRAEAQVKQECGPGRTCTANQFVAQQGTGGVAVQVPADTILRFNGSSASPRISYNSGTAQLNIVGATAFSNTVFTADVRPSADNGMDLGTGALQYRDAYFSRTHTFTTANGTNAIALSTTGARIDLGAGASDYLVSDGTRAFLPAGLSTTGAAVMLTGNGTITTDGLIKTTGSPAFQAPGAATASLGAATQGNLSYDTTKDCHVSANGSTWNCLPRASTNLVIANWTAHCIGDCAETEEFAGGFQAAAAHTVQKLSCSWGAAGTASGGTDAVVIELRDETAGSTLCTCTLAADCTVAAGTVQTCDCSGTMTSGNEYELRFASSSNCTSDPDDIVCNVRYVP